MRTSDSIKVLNYVFNNYSNINIESLINSSFSNFEKQYLHNVIIKKSTEKPLLKIEDFGNTIYPLTNNEFANLKIQNYSLNYLSAPIKENEKIGFLTIKCGDEILKKLDICVKNNIEKKDFKIYYREMLKNIFNFL